MVEAIVTFLHLILIIIIRNSCEEKELAMKCWKIVGSFDMWASPQSEWYYLWWFVRMRFESDQCVLEFGYG